jgi:hypothetical protein
MSGFQQSAGDDLAGRQFTLNAVFTALGCGQRLLVLGKVVLATIGLERLLDRPVGSRSVRLVGSDSCCLSADHLIVGDWPQRSHHGVNLSLRDNRDTLRVFTKCELVVPVGWIE